MIAEWSFVITEPLRFFSERNLTLRGSNRAMPVSIKLQSRAFYGSETGPHLLITGGVHGDEYEPMAAIRELIRRFESSIDELQCGRVTLIPVVNEAAFLRGSRTADDGLDLARVCPGRRDGSITERIAVALSEQIQAADLYIDLHTGGVEFDVTPLAGYTLHPNAEILDQQRQMAQAFNLPLIWGTSAELDGRSLSVARDAGVPAIYAEFRGPGPLDTAGVEAYVDGCRNLMTWLNMLDRPMPASHVRRVVEDPRPASGHMQVCNPSPITGFFEPAVGLESAVEPGDLLGTISDPIGNVIREVLATQSGTVITLRAVNRVLEGESVGVVLEIED